MPNLLRAYREEFKRTLPDLWPIRQKADYRPASVSEREAAEAVGRAEALVGEVATKIGG